MKFRFRLEVLARQRKAEKDIAQREYAEAQKAVRDQLALIEKMYGEIDEARLMSDQVQVGGGACAERLQSINNFISGHKIRIANSRQKARELMAVEEEKHEILIEKMQAHKILENLKSKKKQEHNRLMKKKEIKEVDDIVTMNFKSERET